MSFNMMNGHHHVMEGSDDPDVVVVVEMIPRSTQVILTFDNKKSGAMKVMPAMFHTHDAMKVAYMLVEKVIDVMMMHYMMGVSQIENHTLLTTFDQRGAPTMILATPQYEFVSDAMATKTLIKALTDEVANYSNIIVMMKGERDYEEDTGSALDSGC